MKKLYSHGVNLGVIAVLVFLIGFADNTSAKTRAVGKPSAGDVYCFFTEPRSTDTYQFLTYPQPASYDGYVSQAIRVPEGQIPNTQPSKEFNLDWRSVVEKTNYTNEPLSASGGYTATLSSDASGNDWIQPIRNQSVALSGSLATRIKNDPITYTLTVKKSGAEVATCSVKVTHTVQWEELYVPPANLVPTGNPLFPFTLKSVVGKDYMNKPLPAATGYTAPIKKFVGRYWDSRQGPMSIGRAQDPFLGTFWGSLGGLGAVKVTEDKIYILLGSIVTSWDKNNFITRISTEPLKVFEGTRNRYSAKEIGDPSFVPYVDAGISWEDYFYPDKYGDTGWTINWGASHTVLRIGDMVFDDRGYIYLSHQNGIGIIRDDGETMRPVSQITAEEGEKTLPFFRSGTRGSNKITNAGAPPDAFIGGNLAILKSGISYYLLAHGGYINSLYNITDPLNPQFIRNSSEQITSVKQYGDSIAVMSLFNTNVYYPENSMGSKIKIYNAADFIAGLSPKKVFLPGSATGARYIGLDVDKNSGKFFSMHYSNPPAPKSNIPSYILPTVSISVFAPGSAGGAVSYTETKHALSTESMGGRGGSWSVAKYVFSATGLSYNNGYLIASGFGGGKFWVFKDGKPVEIMMSKLIEQYMEQSPDSSISIENINDKDYLFIRSRYASDVYELEPSGASANNNNQTTTNPNPNPNPATSGTCNASITFDKTSVPYGGSATETWTIDGADAGQVYGGCGAGDTQISAGPRSFTFTNLTRTTTCRVYGKIAGVEKCSASATVNVGTAPAGQQNNNANQNVMMPAENNASQYSAASISDYDFGTTTLRQGSSGPAVQDLQTFLNNEAGANLAVDGKMGPKTTAEVKKWQTGNGLVSDGLVGPRTKEKMNRVTY